MMSRPRPPPPTAQPPPPYRAPPPHPHNGPPPLAPKGAYSAFNVSEPNIQVQQSYHPSGYRHTINHENSSQMQHGLRNLLTAPKHQTLDASGQSYALQQLRSNGLFDHPRQQYVSPDNLRDTANRMFTRNQEQRSSFGNNYPPPPDQQYGQRYMKPQQLNPDDPKRHSFTNQSFRKATGQEKVPPQVPPKPQSRSTSREKLREEVDNLDEELKHILRGEAGPKGRNGTPPLPALSPGPPGRIASQQQNNVQSPDSSPSMRGKYKLNQSSQNLNRPDLLESETMKRKGLPMLPGGVRRVTSVNTEFKGRKDADDIVSQTTGLDLESVMGLQTDLTSDDELSTTLDMNDAQAIRKQLDGLENMYTEVLKLLGLRKYGRPPAANGFAEGKLNGRRKMYGSMSSLPSVSSIGSRHIYKDKRKEHDPRAKRAARTEKNSTSKRFQRLESHVVTLARSVAHLSSEMRTQQAMVQEIEVLKHEMQQIKMGGGRPNQGGYLDPENFFPGPKVSPIQANRVKKLTKFFGDEPPLLRIFLKNLGYEKYAGLFEEAKIGMLELPYLSEERLDKLGVPLGPRMRIMQEAKVVGIGSLDQSNYNVYIL